MPYLQLRHMFGNFHPPLIRPVFAPAFSRSREGVRRFFSDPAYMAVSSIPTPWEALKTRKRSSKNLFSPYASKSDWRSPGPFPRQSHRISLVRREGPYFRRGCHAGRQCLHIRYLSPAPKRKRSVHFGASGGQRHTNVCRPIFPSLP